VRQCVAVLQQCVQQCAAVCGNAAVRQRVRQCAAVRVAVCGNARGGVCLFVFTKLNYLCFIVLS